MSPNAIARVGDAPNPQRRRPFGLVLPGTDVDRRFKEPLAETYQADWEDVSEHGLGGWGFGLGLTV